MCKKFLLIILSIVMILSLIVPMGKSVKSAEQQISSPSKCGGFVDCKNAFESDNLYSISDPEMYPGKLSGYKFDISSKFKIAKVEVGIEGYTDLDDEVLIQITCDGGAHFTDKVIYDLPIEDDDKVHWIDCTKGFIWKPDELENLIVLLTHIQVEKPNKNFYDWVPVRITYGQYTVTYNANGGENPPDDPNSPYFDGETVIVLGPGSMTRTGYTFVNWNTAPNGSGEFYNPDEKFEIYSDVILYAQWTINKYTVTFDSQGGSLVPPQEVEYGGKVTKPTDPTRDGYTFGGWYKEAGCTNAWDFDNDTVTDNITLYAKWTINKYTVTFEANGGTPVPAQQTLDYGSLVTKPTPDPTKTGYTFGGWYKDADCTDDWDFDNDTMPDHNITLYAKWTINKYIIKATSGPNGSINPSGDIIVTHGDDQTFNFYPDTGYRIADVLVDGISVGKPNSYTFFNVTTNHTIHVEFEVDSTSFFDTKSGARIYIDLVTSLAPRWRVSIPSKSYDTGWMFFNRYTKTNNHFWGEYADTRYHFIIDFYSSGRYHIIFDDRVTRISIKIAN